MFSGRIEKEQRQKWVSYGELVGIVVSGAGAGEQIPSHV